ncbi:MAG: hypothetical protein WAV95_02890 [Azonexus sp.]
MKFLRITDVGDAANADVLIAAHLDSPVAGTVYGSDSVNVTVSGWVLARDVLATVTVVVRTMGRADVRIPLSINRPDVRRRILGDDSGGALLCGFRGQVDVGPESDIFIELGDREYAWKKIEQMPVEPRWLDEVRACWQAFVSSKAIESDDATRLANIDPSIVDTFFIGAIRVCHDASGFIRVSGLPPVQGEHVEAFFGRLAARELPREWVAAAMASGAAALINPFSGRTSYCSSSYAVSNTTNCLVFRDVDEVFFVFQHVTSVDAVYFPLRNLAVLRHHLTVQEVRAGLHQLFRNIGQLLASPGVPKSFGGVIASHGRPYHFYYDVAPAVQLIHEAGLLERLPAVFMLEGGDYFSLKSLYQFDADERLMNAAELNKENLAKHQFLILLGVLFDKDSMPLIEAFDSRLNSMLPALLSTALKLQLGQACQCFPLLWFGVTGQKRAWEEQVEAGVQLVNSMSKVFPALGVCFDGWTSPLNPTRRDEVESAQDALLVESICKRIPDSVQVFNLIGAKSIDKMAFAHAIDFFVANYATGSMHVARFAKKPGLGHISNSMNCDGHIHYRTRRVPEIHVVDVVTNEKLRPDFVSYSISPEIIVNMVDDLMRDEQISVNVSGR